MSLNKVYASDCQSSNAVFDWLIRGGTVLVERVEDLVGEIDNPANIDLVALADFLSSRKWDHILKKAFPCRGFLECFECCRQLIWGYSALGATCYIQLFFSDQEILPCGACCSPVVTGLSNHHKLCNQQFSAHDVFPVPNFQENKCQFSKFRCCEVSHDRRKWDLLRQNDSMLMQLRQLAVAKPLLKM